MDNAELYCDENENQYRTAAEILNDYKGKLLWKEDENVLDVGSGCGTVTTKLILPIIPGSAKLVGVDINADMIKLANKYNNHPGRVQFIQQDISGENTTNVVGEEKFDKVFSFFCLQWVQNQRKAFENMYKSMKPGSKALFAIVADSVIYDLHFLLQKQDRWKEYIKNIEVSPYRNNQSAIENCRKLLESIGFKVMDCMLKKMRFSASNIDSLKRVIGAINPFIMKVPDPLQGDFLDDYIKFGFENGFVEEVGGEYDLPSTYLLVFCSKF